MFRFVFFLLLCANTLAANPAVDVNTAGEVYLAAGIREQVSASLGAMPAKIRQIYAADTRATLSAKQLAAAYAAAKRGFRIDVFEPPALAAFAANLDQRAVKKSLDFLASDTGQRMVAADIAVSKLDEATINKITSGMLSTPLSPERDALFAKLEQAAHSAESAVQIYLTIGRALAVGTELGAGLDLQAAEQHVKSRDAATPAGDMESGLNMPLRRYMAYGYRDLSDADLRKLLSFLDSNAGKTYVKAYIAAMSAGFQAMGRRCGGQIGESWRELAQAQAPPAPQPETGP